MVYETSYETGLRPFVPDTKRGYWANPNDFIYAGIALVFRLDFFSQSWFFSTQFQDAAIIPTYLLTLALYGIPLMVIQSFLGQFSSSSYISAFRLAPLFKGVGYIILAINLCVIMYFSIFAVVPLAYMFASMQSTLPWSCEGFKKWATNLTEEEEVNLCNIKFENDIDDVGGNETKNEYINHHIPSVLYLKHIFNDQYLFSYEDMEFTMSWQLVLCSILVWSLVAIIIYKFFETEKMGQLIRYSVWSFVSLLSICLIRFSFLPGSGSVYRSVFLPHWREYLYGISMIPIYGLSDFGPGWGLLITLSSFNKFKTDIKKSSWIIGLAQMFVIVALSLLTHLTERYFKEVTDNNYFVNVQRVATLYLSSGSVIASMSWANLWSILFFFMLFLGATLLIVIQLFTTLTTIFDEFSGLRERKMEICMMLTGAVAVSSLYFTSNHGVTYFNILSTASVITQNAMNLLLILIVLWVYGRIRFQRDIEFMINKRFSTWQINSLRFVIPLFILLALLTAIIITSMEHVFAVPGMVLISITFVFLPWIFVPLYAIRSMYQSIGTIKVRFQHCCRPNDWYPVDAEERQRYEEAMGNTDVTHHLNEVTEEI